MLTFPQQIQILDLHVQQEVPAQIIRLDRSHGAKIDGTWWKVEARQRDKDREGDHHWKWRTVIGEHRNDLRWEALGVQTEGGDLDGVIIYRLDAKSWLEPQKGAIFVERLASAPRNRPWLVNSPRHQGIGSELLLAAVRQGYSLGLNGRVCLTSLPTESTLKFYRRKGFVEIVGDEDGMIDFELPADMAEKWLNEKGYL